MSYHNETNRSNYQSDAKLYKESTSFQHGVGAAGLSTGVGVSSNRNSRAHTLREQFEFCFKFFAFVFSHIGLGFLVLAYTIFGAFLFKHFEEPSAIARNEMIANIRNDTVNRLWIETYKLNVLYKENWTAMAIKEFEHFQRVLIDAFKDGYWPLEQNDHHHHHQQHDTNNNLNSGLYTRWSFIDSWMYSISIITTIGYANRPLTNEGKLSTMLYALVGIPIMLLFLSTIGNLLGRGLKLLYNFCCTCSTDHSTTFMNLESSHDHLHHLHDNYQVHHIALNNISNTDVSAIGHAATLTTTPGHLLSTTTATLDGLGHCPNKTTTLANKQNYTALNSIQTYPSYHDHTPTANRTCSCDLDVNDPNKLSLDPTTGTLVDHICTNKFGAYSEHAHNCNCTADVDQTSTTFYKDDLIKNMHGNLYTDHESTIAVRENVPSYFCFFLIILYIIGGSIMFHVWEGLPFLDGAYFCFVTLSTIGFGDILPEKTISSNQTESKKRIIIIVLYILGGMTLVAMSFNIIYEQLAFKFKKIGYRIQLHNERTNHHHHHHHDDHQTAKESTKMMNNTSKFLSNEDIDV